MGKLIALVVAFAAIVAFASAQSTTVTTTIEDENSALRQQCRRRIHGQRFNQCQRYLQQSMDLYEEENFRKRPSQGQGHGLSQSCCQELRNVGRQCQCAAVREVFRQAQRQQGGRFGSRQMMQQAQNLPNRCNLRTRQCQMGINSITTITEENHHLSQQCENIRGRRFNQCQNFIQRQISGGSYPLLMSINRQGQQPQGVEQCCNELQNVERECQCDAMQEVYRQAQQQQWSQQGGSRGGQPQTQDLQQIVQSLRNQCNLQVQQCRIPSTMF